MSKIKPHRHHVNKYPQPKREPVAVKPPAPLPPVAEPPAPFPSVATGLDTIDIIHFNDFHRQLQPEKGDDLGGAARLATVIHGLQREHPSAVTVNGGDVSYDDGPITGKNSFEPIPQLFKSMGVQILGLGNHEFQDPTNSYAALHDGLINKFDGDVLCGNVTDKETNQPVPGTKPYTLRRLAGLNVAFIGVCTRDMSTNSHPHVAQGLAVAYLDKTLEALIAKVRSQGADAVVVMAHESYHDCKSIAERVNGIDLLLAAHDHKTTRETELVTSPDGHQTALIEAGSHGEFVGHSRLVVDPRTRRVVRVEGHLIAVDRGVAEDPAVRDIVERYRTA